MNKFIQKLKIKTRFKNLKAENKELKEMLELQIKHCIKTDRQKNNLELKMREMVDLAQVNSMQSGYAENIFKDLISSLSMEYGKAHQSDILIINSANKMQNIVNVINSNKSRYGVTV